MKSIIAMVTSGRNFKGIEFIIQYQNNFCYKLIPKHLEFTYMKKFWKKIDFGIFRKIAISSWIITGSFA